MLCCYLLLLLFIIIIMIKLKLGRKKRERPDCHQFVFFLRCRRDLANALVTKFETTSIWVINIENNVESGKKEVVFTSDNTTYLSAIFDIFTNALLLYTDCQSLNSRNMSHLHVVDSGFQCGS